MQKKFNITDFLIDRNLHKNFGDHISIYYKNQKITYSELARAINRRGSALKELNLHTNERVLLILNDAPDFVISFLAILKIGCFAILTSTFLKKGEYNSIIKSYLPKIVIVDEYNFSKVKRLKNEHPAVTWLITGKQKSGFKSLLKIEAKQSDELASANTTNGSKAFCLFTSCTSGKPKSVWHSHRDLAFCYDGYAKTIFRINPQDRTFSASKLFFAYGLQHNLALPFYTGAAAILFPGKPTPLNILKIINKYKPTLFFAVPTIYKRLLCYKQRKQHNLCRKISRLKSVRLYISAGEYLPPSLFFLWKKELGSEIIDGIGCTESLSDFMINNPGRAIAGSCGFLVKGYQAKLMDGKFKLVSVGKIGDLFLKGGSIGSFYSDGEGRLRNIIKKGWFKTGDKLSKTKNGYFLFHGRSDYMMKVDGLWVSPLEIEEELSSCPDVLESAVVPEKSKDNFIRPKAFIVLRKKHKNIKALIRRLKDHLKKRLPSYKLLGKIAFVESLPRTSTGKLLRNKLCIFKKG